MAIRYTTQTDSEAVEVTKRQQDKPFVEIFQQIVSGGTCHEHTYRVAPKGWLVGWCLTALSAEKGYIVPCESKSFR